MTYYVDFGDGETKEYVNIDLYQEPDGDFTLITNEINSGDYLVHHIKNYFVYVQEGDKGLLRVVKKDINYA